MSGQQTARRAGSAARQAGESGAIRLLGRIGLVGYGVVHLLIAYLAVRVATGEGGEAGKSGALHTLAEQPAGRALLWVIAIGLAALAIWQLAEAAYGHRYLQQSRQRNLRRLTNVAEAAVYGVLAWSATKVAQGGHSQSSEEQAGFTQNVLELPAGRWIVALAGAALVGIAIYLVRRGLRRKFLEDLDLAAASPEARKVVTRLGQVGWVALGVAYGIVGVLIITAAVQFNPERATGLDTALQTLADQPYGTALLLVLAAGLACFGVYCLFDARYRR